jgi:hypothetical protein
MSELTLGDKWHEVRSNIAFHVGKGVHLDLDVVTRFDGNGNSVVRFVVTNKGKETLYEKYDAAATAYEIANGKVTK